MICMQVHNSKNVNTSRRYKNTTYNIDTDHVLSASPVYSTAMSVLQRSHKNYQAAASLCPQKPRQNIGHKIIKKMSIIV